MLTRDFRRPEERTRHPLKPLFSHFFLPTPTTIARLDIRLRRAALYPAELQVRLLRDIRGCRKHCNGKMATSGNSLNSQKRPQRIPTVHMTEIIWGIHK